jgi:hypothetical protein
MTWNKCGACGRSAAGAEAGRWPDASGRMSDAFGAAKPQHFRHSGRLDASLSKKCGWWERASQGFFADDPSTRPYPRKSWVSCAETRPRRALDPPNAAHTDRAGLREAQRLPRACGPPTGFQSGPGLRKKRPGPGLPVTLDPFAWRGDWGHPHRMSGGEPWRIKSKPPFGKSSSTGRL